MSKKMILIFSHKLTSTQHNEAKNKLMVDEFVFLPKDLQNLWSNIPTSVENISDYLLQIRNWVSSIAKPKDYILIQGEFGAVHILVGWAFQNNLTPLYAVTKRIHKELLLPNGNVEVKKIFKHTKFRNYISNTQ